MHINHAARSPTRIVSLPYLAKILSKTFKLHIAIFSTFEKMIVLSKLHILKFADHLHSYLKLLALMVSFELPICKDLHRLYIGYVKDGVDYLYAIHEAISTKDQTCYYIKLPSLH